MACLLILLAFLASAPPPPVLGGEPGAKGPSERAAYVEAMARGDREKETGNLAAADSAFAEAARLANRSDWAEDELKALQGRWRCLTERRAFLATRLVTARMEELQHTLGRSRPALLTAAWRAEIESQLGDPERAIVLARGVLERGNPDQDEVAMGSASDTLAVAYARVGRYGLALREATRAEEIWRKLDRTSAADAARSIAAEIRIELGDARGAVPLLRDLVRDLGDAPSKVRAEALGNLGFALYWCLDDPNGALECFAQAEDDYHRMGDEPSAGLVMLHAAEVHRLQHRLDVAEKIVRDAQARIGSDERFTSDADKSMADVLLGRREPDSVKALALFGKALAKELEKGNFGQAIDCRRGLVEGKLVAGDLAGSIAEARRAMDALDVLGAGLPEEQGAFARAVREQVYASGLQAATSQGDVRVIAEFLERSRAGSLVETLGSRNSELGASVPEGLVKRDRAARESLVAAEVAFQIAVADGVRAAIESRAAQREAAQRVFLDVESTIQREARLAGGMNRPFHSSLAEIQGSLGAAEALVLYSLPTPRYSLRPPRAGALVVSNAGARWVDLGPAQEVVDQCAAVDVARASSPDEAWRSIGMLAARVVRPLGLPKDTRRVLVSPDGVLCLAPLSLCLRGQDASTGVDAVALVPSGTVYRLLQAERARRGSGVLALGDPDYSVAVEASSSHLYGRRMDLTSLTASRAEVTGITRSGDVVLLGKAANVARLQEAAGRGDRRWSSVHFACHGLVDLESPLLSCLALTAGKDDSGYLTALDVSKLRLPSDLVVLSACDTARGTTVKAEGMFGLTRAFMCAGSPRVIAGLWRVDDEATQALMIKFYELWSPKDGSKALGAGAALRKAQEFVASQAKWKHPRYWAAWVLWGLAE